MIICRRCWALKEPITSHTRGLKSSAVLLWLWRKLFRTISWGRRRVQVSKDRLLDSRKYSCSCVASDTNHYQCVWPVAMTSLWLKPPLSVSMYTPTAPAPILSWRWAHSGALVRMNITRAGLCSEDGFCSGCFLLKACVCVCVWEQKDPEIHLLILTLFLALKDIWECSTWEPFTH